MLPKTRRTPRGASVRVVRQLDRIAKDAETSELRVLEVEQHLARLDLRISERLARRSMELMAEKVMPQLNSVRRT